jgi:hypothetical protein
MSFFEPHTQNAAASGLAVEADELNSLSIAMGDLFNRAPVDCSHDDELELQRFSSCEDLSYLGSSSLEDSLRFSSVSQNISRASTSYSSSRVLTASSSMDELYANEIEPQPVVEGDSDFNHTVQFIYQTWFAHMASYFIYLTDLICICLFIFFGLLTSFAYAFIY